MKIAKPIRNDITKGLTTRTPGTGKLCASKVSSYSDLRVTYSAVHNDVVCDTLLFE